MDAFRTEVRLPVEPGEALEWHRRPGAFERLTPPWTPVRVLERTGGIDPGGRVTLRVAKGPLRFTWQLEHVQAEGGVGFADRQRSGPFADYRHDHLFHPDPSGCVLEDRIRFRLPGGALGRAIGARAVQRDFARLFSFRHRTTANDLETHQRYEGSPLSVLVSGASGLVGSSLVPFLTTGGHRVTRLVRGSVAGRADASAWDPASGFAKPSDLEGHDAVVHLAGENIAGGRWSSEKKRRLVESRVRSTRVLVEALSRLEKPPRVLVCASAVGYYGDRGGETLDEASEAGRGFLAELCAQWESEAAAAKRAGIRVVSLRLGLVVSGRGGALAKMRLPFALGLGGTLGSGEHYVSWISGDDVAAACLHAIRRSELEGPVNAVAPGPVTNLDFTRTLGAVLRRPTILPAPPFALRLALGEMADEALLASQRAIPTRLLDTGFVYRFESLESALRHELGAVG